MKLVKIPHPGLKKPCTLLTSTQLKAGVYASLITTMKNDMKTFRGIGLAANQVGKDLSLFVIDEGIAAENNVPTVYANPVITEYGKELDDMEEGCLSIPGLWVPVRRPKKIMFKALDEHGARIKFRARGMLARVLQHETDHLNGLTIKERVEEQ